MRIRSWLLPVVVLMGVQPLFSASALPLQDGEQLTYRVSWAIVRGAGEIKIEARRDPQDSKRLIVTTTTATRGFARWLMAFDARAESIYDLASGQLLSLHETSNTRGREREHRVNFDYQKRQAAHAPIGSAQPNLLEMPPGDPSDLIMALLKTRAWELKEGESRDSLVLFDDDFYELTIHAARLEEIRTPLGNFQTLVLEPRMDKTPPKGMFKRGSSVRVWISQDERRLPVRFDVEFNIGTGTAVLEAHVPPPAAAPSASGTTAAIEPNAKHSRP